MTTQEPMTTGSTRRICGAKRSKGRGACQSKVLYQNGRCRVHGGPTPTGLASPNTKTLKYSRTLPARLLTAYAEAGEDRELVGLRQELQLIDARLLELTGRVDRAGSAAQWARVTEAYAALLASGTNTQAVTAAVAMLGQAIASEVGDSQAWKEIDAAVERRRKLVDSEAKRLQRLHQMVSAERVTAALGGIVESIRRHVTDPATLRAIQGDFEAHCRRLSAGGTL